MPDENVNAAGDAPPTTPLPVVAAAGDEDDAIQRIRTIGGLAAVAIGVLAVTGIGVGALIVGTQTAATIAASTAGVVGSVVGAFFGVKVGTDQTRNAVEGERRQAAKAQVFAAHLQPQQAGQVIGLAQAVAQGEQASAAEAPASGS
jgi:hypothetical protein